MNMAKLTPVGDVIIIRSPYHAALVTEIKRIPGRKYNGDLKVWSVPPKYEEYARAVVRKYFPIEDEQNIEIEGLPELVAGPLAVLRIEFIGENYYAYKKQATIPHEATERYKGYLGCNQSRPWVKQITKDTQGRLMREFMNGQIDYSKANSTGSRGIFLYFYLPPGIYEVNERVSWTRVRKYFIRVERTEIQEITQEEVEQWLSRD
jgi:hypothetical protein